MKPVESLTHPGWYHIQNFEGFDTVLINKQGQLLNLKNNNISSGYFVGHYYKTYIPNKRKQVYVHRLMVSTFIRKILPGEVVNHLDGDKLNNRIENLEITTNFLNNKHAREAQLNKGRNGETIYVIDLKHADPLVVKKYDKIQKFINDVEKDFTVTRSGIFNALKQDKGIYRQRYYFSRSYITDEEIPNCLHKVIVRKEIFSNNIRLFSSIPHAATETGISYEQIDKVLSGKTQYLQGYLFKRYNDDKPWLTFDEASKLFNDSDHEVIVYDLETGLKYLYTCKSHVKTALRVHGRCVEKALSGEDRLINNRYVVKYFKDKNVVIF